MAFDGMQRSRCAHSIGETHRPVKINSPSSQGLDAHGVNPPMKCRPATCEHCRHVFEKVNGRHRFCSSKCRQAHRYGKGPKRGWNHADLAPHRGQYFRGRHPIPEHAHPLVRQFVEAMNREGALRCEVSSRSGVSLSTMRGWDVRHAPRLPELEAAGNALGYELVWRKKRGE